MYQAVSLLKDEQKEPKDYGTGTKVNHIEASFLDIIHKCPIINVSEPAWQPGMLKKIGRQICLSIFI